MPWDGDKASKVKHLRFGKIFPELSDILAGFPGVKSIVLHTHGAKGEHPHYHVWYEGTKAVTGETIRNHLRKHHEVFKSYSGQNDWSFRPHDNFETWAAYVQRNKTHKVLWLAEGTEMPPPKDTIELIFPTPPTITPVIAAPKPKKLTAEERLINYCIREEGFKYNQWTTTHYEIVELRKQMQDRVSEALVTYANGRLSNQQMIYMGRNIIWTFADPDLRVGLTNQWTQEARKFW